MAEMYRDSPPLPADEVYRVARTAARPVTLLPGHDPRVGVGARRSRGGRSRTARRSGRSGTTRGSPSGSTPATIGRGTR